MSVQVRDFTEWQIDRIRLSLNKYRITAARDGYLPSWTTVRDSIIFAEPNIARYKRDPENSFHPERLRRFALGRQRLDVAKLGDIVRFLLHAGILKADALEEADTDLTQFLAVREFLGSSGESARKYVGSLKGRFQVRTKSIAGETTSILLRLMPDSSQIFLRVEETLQISSQNAAMSGRKNDPMRNTKRVGYAFPVTSRNALHAFLNGFTPDHRITYVQALDLLPDERPDSHLLLMRNGDGTEQHHAVDDTGARIDFPNIFRFIPVSEGDL